MPSKLLFFLRSRLPVFLKPIGVIHSSFKTGKGTPIQSALAHNHFGTIELYPKYQRGLKDIEGFDYLWITTYLDRSAPPPVSLQVTPFLDTQKHGIFATRSPTRPNPIGLSKVKLVKVESNKIIFSGVDMIDKTPVLDIKPFVPKFDSTNGEKVRAGWFDKATVKTTVADDRFEPSDKPKPV